MLFRKGAMTLGSVMVEMMRMRAPQSGQARTSMAKTRSMSSAQVRRRLTLARVGVSVLAFCRSVRGRGTIPSLAWTIGTKWWLSLMVLMCSFTLMVS